MYVCLYIYLSSWTVSSKYDDEAEYITGLVIIQRKLNKTSWSICMSNISKISGIFQGYGEDKGITNSVDRIQKEYSCCGANSFTDWRYYVEEVLTQFVYYLTIYSFTYSRKNKQKIKGCIVAVIIKTVICLSRFQYICAN